MPAKTKLSLSQDAALVYRIDRQDPDRKEEIFAQISFRDFLVPSYDDGRNYYPIELLHYHEHPTHQLVGLCRSRDNAREATFRCAQNWAQRLASERGWELIDRTLPPTTSTTQTAVQTPPHPSPYDLGETMRRAISGLG